MGRISIFLRPIFAANRIESDRGDRKGTATQRRPSCDSRGWTRAKKRELDGCQRPWLGLLSGLLGAFLYRLLDMQDMHVVSSLLELLVLLRGVAASLTRDKNCILRQIKCEKVEPSA